MTTAQLKKRLPKTGHLSKFRLILSLNASVKNTKGVSRTSTAPADALGCIKLSHPILSTHSEYSLSDFHYGKTDRYHLSNRCCAYWIYSWHCMDEHRQWSVRWRVFPGTQNSSGSGINWIDAIFRYCVVLLVNVAKVLGISYETLNIWVFLIIQPLLIVFLLGWALRLRRKVNKFRW